jgi:hypothetical protein
MKGTHECWRDPCRLGVAGPRRNEMAVRRPLPMGGVLAGQGRKAATEPLKLCGRVQEATLFWGREGRQASEYQ